MHIVYSALELQYMPRPLKFGFGGCYESVYKPDIKNGVWTDDYRVEYLWLNVMTAELSTDVRVEKKTST